ncbi:MAG TPA: lysylphosphatidylglycerol synthase transmembrane domain-containing protein [Leptospiraceae bacterium]|nr:lysylphosphatidylglycerol synthase transmembrane domain-containing protein [Leptospiraceae bacterium]HRG77924.1 lysylphosphatidylglycerol synthase transmembrane domain-containing protein [Leptospiraceae bacterium]
MKKLFIGILVSVLFVGIIAFKFDFRTEFSKIGDKISYIYLIPITLTQLIGLVIFSFRWRLLLEKKINAKHAISSSFIGYAANMVLPARGGDLFRVFYCRSETDVQYFHLLSKLFIEKVIDFIFVIMTGVISFFIIGLNNPNQKNYTVFTVSGLIILGIVFSLYLIRFQNEFIQMISKKIFTTINKEKFYKDHIEEHLIDLKDFLQIQKFIYPVILTIVSWFFYFSNYYFVNVMLGGNVTEVEIVFLLFCGAMSLALPSAPSGIGVFHASIISGFLLIGKDTSYGLLYATAVHLISFVNVTFVGLIFYVYWTYRRRHGKPVKPTQTV